MFVDGLEQNNQSLERTLHRCCLPSFTSFGWAVSEEKIKMWKRRKRQRTTEDRWRTPSDGKNSHCLWQGELKTWTFCCVKDNNIISGIVNTITEWNLKKRIFNTLPVVRGCRPVDNLLSSFTLCLGCLPRQEIFRKTSKLSYYFYIAKICKV
jgi:hypothetical protein